MIARRDDTEFLGLLVRLGQAHVERAEEALEGLRGRGRGQFMDERREELEALKVRLAKAARVRANETTLDCGHILMRDIERLHDSIIAAVTGHEAELAKWMQTVGVAS
jgi:hypothetical protein